MPKQPESRDRSPIATRRIKRELFKDRFVPNKKNKEEIAEIVPEVATAESFEKPASKDLELPKQQ